MPVLSLACHLPHNTPNIPSRYNNEQTTKQTKAINNSYIYISHVNVTQTVPDISPLMPMHQDPLLVKLFDANSKLLILSLCCWKKHLMHTRPLLTVFHLQKSCFFLSSSSVVEMSIELFHWQLYEMHFSDRNICTSNQISVQPILNNQYWCSLLTHCPLGDMAVILKMQ